MIILVFIESAPIESRLDFFNEQRQSVPSLKVWAVSMEVEGFVVEHEYARIQLVEVLKN
jgi:hypothetical protein